MENRRKEFLAMISVYGALKLIQVMVICQELWNRQITEKIANYIIRKLNQDQAK